MRRFCLFMGLTAALALAAAQTSAAPKPSYPPTPWPIVNGGYDIHSFRFETGQTIPDLHLHYLTLGTPRRDAAGHTVNAVLLLHGTGGSAHSLLNPVFSDVLFGPGQPLDITKYFIILPDDIGHGESSKPSDGLRMNFPQLHLRRHGPVPAPMLSRRSPRRPSAPDPRHLDGLHADVRVGRNVSAVSPTR